jgi:hypothetical protein
VSSAVSEPLKLFLQQRLASIEQIEIVLLLRVDRARSWSAPEVASELRMPPESAAMRLFLLASSGMLLFEPSGVPRYRYAGGGDAETDALVGELAEVYSDDKNAVALLVGAPVDPLQSFADAFKFKK